jgi:hypothetical protein
MWDLARAFVKLFKHPDIQDRMELNSVGRSSTLLMHKVEKAHACHLDNA